MSLIRSFAIAAILAAPVVAMADTPKAAPAPTKPSPDVTKKDAAPPAKTEVSKAEAEKFVAFFNKLIDVIVANQDDCTKMASGISTFIDSNQALIAEGKAAKNSNKELPKEYKDKMDARISKDMLPALKKKCITDKGVQAAMQKMDDKK